MYKNEEDIRLAHVSSGINAGISSSISFVEWEACIAAGLDMHKWETGVYPPWFKSRAVAWFNLHNLVELHKNEAQVKAAKRAQHG